MDLIIAHTIEQLEHLDEHSNQQYIEAKHQVIKLQKQLLSASRIGKQNLEQQIKAELRVAEQKMFEANSELSDLERNYLVTYIKENYE